MPDAHDPLTDANLDDLLDAVGLAQAGLARTLLASLLRPAARRFARTVRDFDSRVGREGLAAGSRWLVHRMAGGVQVRGAEELPRQGPLLVLANHPGMTDTVALFASLAARADLRVIAYDRPFLRALPHVARHVIFVQEDGASRSRVLREGIRHLQRGGALLSFPAGAIEPDPAACGAEVAAQALAQWSHSYALLLRAVPATCVCAAIVSQVIHTQALHHPIPRLRRRAADRDKLAAALQILWRPYQALPARVAFARVDVQGAAPAHRAVLQAVHTLLQAESHASAILARTQESLIA
jgi:putative hemolysin